MLLVFPSFLPPSLPSFLPSLRPSLSNPMFFYPRKIDPEKILLIPNLFDPTNFLTPIPHNTLTHTTSPRTTYSHTTCSHTTLPHTHTQLLHTQLTHKHNSLTHAHTVAHTKLSHTQLTHRHNSPTHNALTHNSPTHNTPTPSLCVACVKLMALGWLWWRAWFPFVAAALCVAGVATFIAYGRRGTYGTGLALVARLVPVCLRCRRGSLCGRRGTCSLC